MHFISIYSKMADIFLSEFLYIYVDQSPVFASTAEFKEL